MRRIFVALALACSAALAHAQAYPSKPILMVLPLAAGSSFDVVLRMIVQKMSEGLGQPIVVENQAGAAGMIGAERITRASPDGYTLAAFNDSLLTMVPNLRAKVPYDPVTSFAPVSLMVNNSWILVTHPSLQVSDVRGLIALAKSKPGAINYSSGGNGSPQHIAMALFESMAGIKLTHVPYKGTTQATLDVMSGQIPMMFSATNGVMGQLRDGKLRGLAVGGATRSPLFPAVPTVAETGLPGYEFVTWMGMFAPLNTPKEIIARLNGEIVRILRQPDLREKFLVQGVELVPTTPEEFGAFIKQDIAKWAKVIQLSGVRAE